MMLSRGDAAKSDVAQQTKANAAKNARRNMEFLQQSKRIQLDPGEQ